MQRNGFKRWLMLSALLGVGLMIMWRNATQTASAQQQATRVDFTRDILPLVQTHCAGCHGTQKQMSQLNLLNPADVRRVIVAGNSAASRLLHRVRGLNQEPRMPKGGAPLSDPQIALLARWIDEGATIDQSAMHNPQSAIAKHWGFTAPVRPVLPAVKQRNWVRNPIDAFVLARLEREGLSPAPEADRVTLLRRLSLDLIGLPPTPEEVDAFLRDRTPNAYEKQVKRLLASPHYGERWARPWLDAARYADSDGFEKDKPREVWFYRDWVINALNQDKPYDQFIIEQVAGDLLPPQADAQETQAQRVATGFLRNSMINEEGGVDPEQFRMEAMFDRMDAIGKGVLGLTIQCAQCHNHKFDPLKQEEYYRLFAFLNNSHEGAQAVYTSAEQMQRANILTQTREIEAQLKEQKNDWLAAMNAWEDRVKNDQPAWTVIQPAVDDISTGGARYLPQPDGSFIVGGYAPAKHRSMLVWQPKAESISAPITAFRLELLTDPNLPLNGPGRSYKGSCALTEFEVEQLTGAAAKAQPAPEPDADETSDAETPKKTVASQSSKDKIKLKFARATADANPPERELEAKFNDRSGKHRVSGPIAFAIDGKTETGWSIDVGPGLRNQARKAVFQLAAPLSIPTNGLTLRFFLNQGHGGTNNNDNEQQGIGRFRLSYTTAADAQADPLPAAVREIFQTPRAQRSAAQIETVFRYWRTIVPEFAAANAQIAALWQMHPEGSSQLMMQERTEMRPTFTLKRGDFLRPDRSVAPGVPSFLHPLPANVTNPTRLDFARWLVARESPTTARSAVNRLWQSYFGTGLLATAEDFGKQADAPSHPELLDWLAVELMEPSLVARGEGLGARSSVVRRLSSVASNALHNTGTASSRTTRTQKLSTQHAARSTENWSLKHIHRLIVTSATYRQASHVTPELLARDPGNRLLARGARLRVEAELVRDIALSASGLLNAQVGGRSVYAPAPQFIFLPPVSYGAKNWREEQGVDRYRRALYTFRFRSVPYPMLQTFDAPNGDAACVRRARSNTPLQALTALNETLFLEAAHALAQQILTRGGHTLTAQIEYAFRRVLARRPTMAETTELAKLWETQHARFVQGQINPQDVWQWQHHAAAQAAKLPTALPTGATSAQFAAWANVARVLLNLDEALTKE